MRWRPDTCGCVIDADFATNTATSVVPCAIHAALTSPPAIFEAVRAENTLKNHAHGATLDDAGLAVNMPGPDGGFTRRLREGIEFAWFFDATRRLTVQVRGASAADLARLESALALSLGVGRVKVEDTGAGRRG